MVEADLKLSSIPTSLQPTPLHSIPTLLHNIDFTPQFWHRYWEKITIMTTILHNFDFTFQSPLPRNQMLVIAIQSIWANLKKYPSLLAYLIYMIYNAAYAELKILRRRCFDALPTAPPRLFTFSQENSGSGGNASFPNLCTFKKAREGFFVQFSSLAKSKDPGRKQNLARWI